MDDTETTELTAKARLRAFEDETLGKDATRINGEIEKGHGSHFKVKLTEQQRHHHAALEHLVAAEHHLANTSAAHAAATTALEAAEAKIAILESAADGEPE